MQLSSPGWRVSDLPGVRASHGAWARSLKDDPCTDTCPGSRGCFSPAQVLQEPTALKTPCPLPEVLCWADAAFLGTLRGPTDLLRPVGGRPSASAPAPPGRLTELSAAWDLGALVLTASPRGYSPPAAARFTCVSARRPVIPGPAAARGSFAVSDTDPGAGVFGGGRAAPPGLTRPLLSCRAECQAWTGTLLLGTCLLYCARVSMPVCAVSMSQDFGWNKKEAGIVLSSFFWGYCLTQVVGGHLGDR